MDKLKGLPTIHYISLEESVDRRNNLHNWFEKYNITDYVPHLFKRFNEYNYELVGPHVDSLDVHAKGCIASHFSLLKDLYENNNDEYFLIVEDDLSLESVEYWNFSWKDFYNNLPEDWNCIQMVIIREYESTEYYFEQRRECDWCAAAYLIKRDHIKNVLDLYYSSMDLVFNLDVNCTPVLEHLLFSYQNHIYTFPLFLEDCCNVKSTAIITENTNPTNNRDNHYRSYNNVINWWKHIGVNLNIQKIMEGKMNHIYQEPQFGEDWFTYPNLYREMVQKFPSGSKFVEVGSWKGKSSAFMAVEIANSYKDIDFYCVDTWEGGVDHQNLHDLTILYDTFMWNMESLKDYHTPMRMTSLESAEKFEDQSLDFVFIDASHEYEDVKNDIIAWLPKIKEGGIIAGHDYYVNEYDYFPGVKRAVNEIFNINELKFDERCWIHKKVSHNKVTDTESFKVLFFGRNNKKEVAEHKFIHHKILPSNISKKDYFMFLDDVRNSEQTFDVFVYSARSQENYPWGWIPSYDEVLEAVLKTKPKIIIQLSDEYPQEDLQKHNELGNYCELFLRQYHHSNYTYTENTHHIPVYINNDVNTDNILSINERIVNWGFVGCDKSDRKECIEKFLKIDNFIISLIYEDAYNGKDSVITEETLLDIYNNTIFSPATRGWAVLNTSRIFEATMRGSIPVVVGSEDEINETFKYEENPPWIFADSWESASNICKELLNNREQLQKIQDDLLIWWDNRLSKIGKKVNQILLK